jgi:hypothetical protein
MAYIEEHYPNRTMKEEIELVDKFMNPVVLSDNGPGTIGILEIKEEVEAEVIIEAETEPEFEPDFQEKNPMVVGTITPLIESKNEVVIEPEPEPEPEIGPEMEEGVSYTEDDIHLLGDVMYIEAEEYTYDEEGETCLKAVGSVVLHRMNEDQGYYPDTIYGVIHDGEGTSHKQYASGVLKKIGNAGTPDLVYGWAEDLLRDGPIGPNNMVFEANFKQGDEVWLKYGKMYFCTSNKIPVE